MPLSQILNTLFKHGVAFFDVLNLDGLALSDLHLTIEESLFLAVDCADVHLALALLDDNKVLVVDECDLSGSWADQLKELLTRGLVIDLQRPVKEDSHFPVSRERAEHEALDDIVGPSVDHLIEHAELLDGEHSYLLGEEVARDDVP